MAWASAPIYTKPPAGTVIADTGPLPYATYTFILIIEATVGLDLYFQLVDTDGTTVLKSQVIAVTLSFLRMELNDLITPLKNQRIRLVNRSDVNTDGGEVQASIFYCAAPQVDALSP